MPAQEIFRAKFYRWQSGWGICCLRNEKEQSQGRWQWRGDQDTQPVVTEAIALLTVHLQVLDQHKRVRGRNRSSDLVFSQGDGQESWWMNHRLEVLMVQPHPTLKSSSALLSQNNLLLSRKTKRGCLNDWPPLVDGGWSSKLESLHNCPPATATGSSVLLLPDQGLWEGLGT